MNAIAPGFGFSAEGIPFDIALARVLGHAAEELGVEDVPLAACAGRVIAAPFVARLDLPGFDQSAMDGYAVRCADLTAGAYLAVTGRTAAGEEAPGHLASNGLHRILTGAPCLSAPMPLSLGRASVNRAARRSAVLILSSRACPNAR
jgi:molybdopterin molybdotransferase